MKKFFAGLLAVSILALMGCGSSGSDSVKSVDGSYIAAGAVTNWDNVLSVRFSLLLASENNGVVDTPMSVSADPAFPDGTSTAPNGDRRLYKSLTFTAALRNRIQ